MDTTARMQKVEQRMEQLQRRTETHPNQSTMRWFSRCFTHPAELSLIGDLNHEAKLR